MGVARHDRAGVGRWRAELAGVVGGEERVSDATAAMRSALGDVRGAFVAAVVEAMHKAESVKLYSECRGARTFEVHLWPVNVGVEGADAVVTMRLLSLITADGAKREEVEGELRLAASTIREAILTPFPRSMRVASRGRGCDLYPVALVYDGMGVLKSVELQSVEPRALTCEQVYSYREGEVTEVNVVRKVIAG